ncbi:MAG: hypothetical protein ACJ76F_11665 [Bacteroidia bacterium]
MKFNYLKLKTSFITLGAFMLLTLSCGNDKNNPPESTDETAGDTEKVTNNGVLNVGGELFSIPSPVQTAMLIQKSGAAYDKSILNLPANNSLYKTDFSKALNLGIYGADLGYVTMYNKTQDALSFLASVKRLADDLGVSGAFDQATMERINKNITVKDSMLVLVGIAYRASDAYLKNNQRNDVSGLILTGGWIESLNFAIMVNKDKSNEEIKIRIAEQKQALASIIKLLGQYSSQPEYTTLIDGLKDLNKVYETIEFKYVYEAPVIDVANKTTSINSRTEVNVSKEQIDQITAKVQAIRDKIVNPVKS